jgi:hypothetical protein
MSRGARLVWKTFVQFLECLENAFSLKVRPQDPHLHMAMSRGACSPSIYDTGVRQQEAVIYAQGHCRRS